MKLNGDDTGGKRPCPACGWGVEELYKCDNCGQTVCQFCGWLVKKTGEALCPACFEKLSDKVMLGGL